MSTYLITGANRGLGLEFARQLADRGDRVIACCRNPSAADDLNLLAEDEPDHVTVHALEVTDGEQVSALARRLDGRPIDVLINNAGIYGSGGQTLDNLDYAGWQHVFDVNVFGPTRVLTALLPNLRASDRKLAITITSGMGSMGDEPGGMYYAYRSSKSAVNMVMKNASADLRGDRISVVVMNPGWVQTDMGGPNASITPHTSISMMLEVIDRLDFGDTGTFYNYTGEKIPW